jgi:flagellar motor switch protein FliG
VSDPSDDVAALLLTLDEPQAAVLLSGLPPADVERVGRAMLRHGLPRAERAHAAADRFLAAAEGDAGAVGDVPALLQAAFDPPRADAMARRIGVTREAGAPLLDWLDAGALAAALAGEHPQAIAAVVARLAAADAARIVSALPEGVAASVLARAATLRPVHPVAEALLAEALSAAAPPPAAAVAGPRAVAKVIALLDGERAKAVRAALAAADPEAAAAVEENSVTLDDLLGLPPRALQTVLRGCEGEDVALSLRGMDPGAQEQLLAAMPQRSAAALRDQLAEATPAKAADVAAAQRRMIAVLKRLRASGEIEG